MPKEIISEEEIPLPIVKKLLSQRAKESEEPLSFQQSITLEHASAFSKMPPAASLKLVEKLMKSYDIPRAQAVQLVNIAPETAEELRTILDVRATSLTEEQIIEIVDLVAKSKS
jgi:DNA-directed RNA polymerase subunit F